MFKIISVIGGADADKNSIEYNTAYKLGRMLNKDVHVLVTGGMTGVMEAVSKGAREVKTTTIGILPDDVEGANPYVDIPLSTGLRISRDGLVVICANLVIAIPGGLGTLNEACIALKVKKRVIVLKTPRSEIFYKALEKLSTQTQRNNLLHIPIEQVADFFPK